VTAIAVRDAQPADAAPVARLYAAAFPQEDLLPLVQGLSQLGGTALALVAADDAAILGHAIVTRCGLDGRDGQAALLGPVAVLPAAQRRGIGSALIRAALARLAERGTRLVLVLGDPGYYRRFGFAAEAAVQPPCPIPPAWRPAWQSLALGETATLRGRLAVPPPWQVPALWGP
jgi:putative acetyltransferase